MFGLLRNALEGVLFVLLFPLWLLLSSAAYFAGWLNGRQRVAGAWNCACRRWVGFVVRGLRLYRESWWPLPQHESALVFWRHALWTEFFAALNQAGRNTKRPERFLVIKLAHIGDAMHIAPMLHQLRREKPDAEIDLLVGPWCEDLAARWSVPGKTWIYTPHIMVFHRGQTKKLRRFFSEGSFLMALRRRRYTCILSTSTMSIAEWLLVQAANPDQWIGADNPVTKHYQEIPSQSEPYASRMYESDRVSGLLHYLDMKPDTGFPEYPVKPEEREWALQQWGNASGRILIAPGAGWPGKIWPAGRFAEVANMLIREYGVAVIITGAPDEKYLGDEIIRQAPEVMNVIGATTFGQTAALVESADLLVCNDSGPLHLAAAFATPSVAVFGPTIASKWQPPGVQHRMIQKAGFCEGCVGWHPAAHCLHENACMKAISVDEVMTEARNLLNIKKEATT